MRLSISSAEIEGIERRGLVDDDGQYGMFVGANGDLRCAVNSTTAVPGTRVMPDSATSTPQAARPRAMAPRRSLSLIRRWGTLVIRVVPRAKGPRAARVGT